MHSFLGLPLMNGNEIVGMIGIANRPKGYDEELIKFLEPLLTTSTSLIYGFRERDKAKQAEQELEELALNDAFTELPNRRRFDNTLRDYISRAERYDERLSLIYFDLDHFKKVNDTYGHQIGDNVLKQFAQVLKNILRESDLPCRLGGEEFAVILPNLSENGALIVGNRIRKILEKNSFTSEDGKVFRVTCSGGIATYESGLNTAPFASRADEALYDAKGAGRNRISIWSVAP